MKVLVLSRFAANRSQAALQDLQELDDVEVIVAADVNDADTACCGREQPFDLIFVHTGNRNDAGWEDAFPVWFWFNRLACTDRMRVMVLCLDQSLDPDADSSLHESEFEHFGAREMVACSKIPGLHLCYQLDQQILAIDLSHVLHTGEGSAYQIFDPETRQNLGTVLRRNLRPVVSWRKALYITAQKIGSRQAREAREAAAAPAPA